MNSQNQQVFNTATANTNSFGSFAHNPYSVQQADSAYANVPPMHIPAQVPPLSSPNYQQQFAFDPNYIQSMQNQPSITPQPQFIPSMMPIYQMDFNNQMQTLPAPAVFPFPLNPQLGLPYAGVTPNPPPMFFLPGPAMTPAPPFESVEVPANMQVYEAVNGQFFPVMKSEEQASISNASSDSGLTSGTPPPTKESQQQLQPKRTPPGFSNQPKPQTAQPEPKRSETINYARAAKSRVQPTFKQSVRSNASLDKVSPVKRESAPRKATPHNVTRNPRPKRKFGFRSKQNMIDKVYEALSRKYTDLGILASSDEVLRGEDTIRLHVKKFKALKRIQEALEAVEREPSISIAKVSIPLSMKNQFQKKGFLVYTQVADVSMVAGAKQIFQQFDEFKKCEVARQTSDNSAKMAKSIVEDHPAPVEKLASPAKEDEDWSNVSFEEEGHVEETTKPARGEPEHADFDPFCGSVENCDVSFNAPATGSPELIPANKFFEDDGDIDCGLGIDLAIIDMCPMKSFGEAGQ